MNYLRNSEFYKRIMKNKRVECLVCVLVLILFFGFTEANATSGVVFYEDFNWEDCTHDDALCQSTGSVPYKNFDMGGVNFRITATEDGDGSAVAWLEEFGNNNTHCITLLSGDVHGNTPPNTTTVERFTIAREDGKPWVLNSLWADKQPQQNQEIILTGTLNGTVVITKKCDRTDQTIDFKNAIIDTLTITSKDFYDKYFTIDNLKGNTEATINKSPTASNFTANTIYEETAHAFETADFGYTDGDSDELDHIKIIEVPSDGTLWIDSNNDNIINSSEMALGNNSTITKSQLDSAMLKYINVNGISTAFTFKVNDGKTYSDSSYSATLNVTPKPTVTLSVVSNSHIDENGGKATIKATLSNIYDKKAIVNLAFTGTVSMSDYSVPSIIEIPIGQTSSTVTITGTDDIIYEGEEAIIIDIDSVTNCKESGVQQVTCSITDDDPEPLVTLQVEKTELTENPENCIVTVVKQGNTAQDITVNLGISGTVATGDYTIGSTQITISANEMEKTTTLASLQDTIDESDETIIVDIMSVTNAIENGTQQKTVTIIDDDPEPTVSLFLENSPLVENSGQARLKATLSEESGKDITVNLGYVGTSSNSDYTANSQIIITAGDTEGSLMITGNNDDIDEDTETIDIDITSITNAIENGEQKVTAEITDDDIASLTITQSDGITLVNESGTTDTFTVALATKPVCNVVLNITSADTDEVDIDKATLTFTEDNWNLTQTVTLTGIDDYLLDGRQTIPININVDDTQSDDKYDGLSKSINVLVENDDIAGFTIIKHGISLMVTEDGDTDSFKVKLNAQPETDVVINIISDDITEKTISPSSLKFTKEKWNVEQEVIVTGEDDDSKDDEQHTLIILSIDQANTDNAFDLVADQNIAVTTIDNDVPNLVITKDNAISVSEGVADTEEIKIRLATQPADGNDVNITLTPSDTSEISLSETVITILNADWNKDYTVTIQSVEDTELDGDITSSIDIATTSSDSDYSGLKRMVEVTTIDNEHVGMTISSNNNHVDNGSTTPTVNNNTDFGNVDINTQTVTKTYNIQNTGNYDLNFTNTPYITITGSSEFTIENQPTNTVVGGSNTTFTLRFDPSTIGEKIATVSIANNDIDKNPYTFTIKGTGTEDIDAPTITNFSPSNGESNIDIDSNLEITFNENITKGTGNIKIFKHSDDILVESISINDIVINGKVVTINLISNLANGNKYYVQIDNNAFTDEIGNEYQGITDKTTWSFTTVRQSSTPSGGGNSSSNNIFIKLNGKKQDSLGRAKTKYKNGKKVITVTINEKKLEEKLNKEAKGAKVTIPVDTKKGSVEGQFNGHMVKKMEEKEATVEIKTEKATYTLPATQINIDKISDELGEDIDLEDIDVRVKIGETSKEMVKIVEEIDKKDNFNIVVSPVDFEVICSYNNKEINVSKFNSYVERLIALPEDIDPSKITTGIIMYPDGTTCHVPTKVIVVDKKYYAKINSLTNSTYTVVWNPKKYADVEEHWGKDTCNEMGARMIVEEESETIFNPDQQITRLFFTETVVKALGLGDKGVNANFTDMLNTDNRFGFVATSVEYELIKGYRDNTFRPNANITREEAATLMLRVMKLVGMKVDYTEEELQNELDKFVDKEDIYDYAKKPIAICAKNGLVLGNDKSKFLPKDNIIKAELAIMIKRMLEKSGLIE